MCTQAFSNAQPPYWVSQWVHCPAVQSKVSSFSHTIHTPSFFKGLALPQIPLRKQKLWNKKPCILPPIPKPLCLLSCYTASHPAPTKGKPSCILTLLPLNSFGRNSLVIQWLGHAAFTTLARRQFLVGELRSRKCSEGRRKRERNKEKEFCSFGSLISLLHQSPPIRQSW